MKTLITLFILTFTLSSCLSYEQQQQEGIRIAAVGDSITYGMGILDKHNNSYPNQLEQLLEKDYDVLNFGYNGATLQRSGDKPYWDQTVFKKAILSNPDIVIIELGTNDSRPENWVNKNKFKEDYLDLIEYFQKLQSSPTVMICTPAPAYKNRWDINNDIISNDIIPIIYEVAKITNVKVIDLYNPLIEYTHYFPDSVHPNKEGAGFIAKIIYSYL